MNVITRYMIIMSLAIITACNGSSDSSTTNDLIAPSLVNTLPGNNSANVSDKLSQIQVTFDEDISVGNINDFSITPLVAGDTSVVGNVIQFTPTTSLRANENYTVNVSGVKDASGNSSDVVTFRFTTGVDTTAPSPPNGLRTTNVSDTSISLQWNAASDNVAVTGYRIMRSDNSATAVEVGTVAGLSYTNSALSSSTIYEYQVFAFDAAGNDVGSNMLNVTTSTTPNTLMATNDSFSTPFETILTASVTTNDTQSANIQTIWELVSQASPGTAVVNADGSFTYTPDSGFTGSVSFTYRMRDVSNNISNTATVNITVQAQQAATGCSTLYASNGGYMPVTNKTVFAIPNTPKPAKGNHFIDTDFNTCIVRVTDHAKDSSTIANRVVPDYSRRQLFNSDQSHVMLLASDGFWHLYDAITYSHIRRVSLNGDSVELQWHPTNPNLLYRMPYNGGLQIFLHDVSDATDGTVSIAADLTNVKSINGYPGFTSVKQVWPNAARFLTAEEGSPSADARYWALMGVSEDFNTSFGIIVYDMQTDSIVGIYDYATDGGGIGGPNNVSMSPSGSHVVALWNPPACDGQNGRPTGSGTLNNPCGTMSFNRDFTKGVGLAFNGEHGDTATDINGRDVYVGIEYQDRGAIEIIDLDTGNLITDIETQVWVGGAVHISGRAYNKPGWVVISHYNNAGNTWYNEEIFMAKLDVNPVIVRLAKHRSNPADYWAQPHATISRDATKVIWGSNWGSPVLDLDTYMITLPPVALDNL